MTASQPSSGSGFADISSDELSRIESTLRSAVQTYRPAWLSDDRDDLVQKALIRILRRKSEGNAAFASSYLWKTAYSVVIDQIRHEQRKRETPLEHVAEPALSKAELPGPDFAYATTELREALQEALQSLSDDRKLAVTLFLQGHTVRETAELLGWSYKRTENLVYRAYKDLRSFLQARGFKP